MREQLEQWNQSRLEEMTGTTEIIWVAMIEEIGEVDLTGVEVSTSMTLVPTRIDGKVVEMTIDQEIPLLFVTDTEVG